VTFYSTFYLCNTLSLSLSLSLSLWLKTFCYRVSLYNGSLLSSLIFISHHASQHRVNREDTAWFTILYSRVLVYPHFLWFIVLRKLKSIEEEKKKFSSSARFSGSTEYNVLRPRFSLQLLEKFSVQVTTVPRSYTRLTFLSWRSIPQEKPHLIRVISNDLEHGRHDWWRSCKLICDHAVTRPLGSTISCSTATAVILNWH
jgi:hypothetical protein